MVADGRLKINPRTRSVLAALGVYQDGVGTNFVNGKPVVSVPIKRAQRHLTDDRLPICTNTLLRVSPAYDLPGSAS